MIERSMRGNLIAAVGLGGSIFLTGCGGPYDSSVTGKVTINGQAVPNGTVAYSPVAGGPAAYGRIEESGQYVIRTGREAGLPSGDYQVTVTANEPSKTLQNEKGGPPAPGKAITPAWYRTKSTSGLKFTIKPGSNTIDLPLNSTPPPGWTGKK